MAFYARGFTTVLSERTTNCVEAKAGGLGERLAASGPRRATATGAAMALSAFLLAPDARAAGDNKQITLAPPRANAEHTLINLGPLAIKMQTSSIVLGLAHGAEDSPGGPYAPNISSFAEARQSGLYSVAGTAKAALTLSFDLGDYLSNAAGRLPIPLGGAGRKLQAALSLEAGGKLSVNVGSSFGFSSSSGAPDKPGGHLSFSINALKPWKHASLRWRYTF
jgi:hypothetical protein